MEDVTAEMDVIVWLVDDACVEEAGAVEDVFVVDDTLALG